MSGELAERDGGRVENTACFFFGIEKVGRKEEGSISETQFLFPYSLESVGA